MQSDAEILSAFRDFMARQGSGPDKFVPLRNHPLHRGMFDASYVRPAPTEFPKMVYHPAGMRKIVASRAEQDALGPSYSETPPRTSGDWKAKLNEVHTKSGFRVYDQHLAFLQAAKIPNLKVETLLEAAAFLDQLDEAQQEQFFREAEEFQPESVEASIEKDKKKKAS